MVRCIECGGRIFGMGACVVCGKHFTKLRENQITCTSKKCRKARQLQVQKIWKKDNRHEFLGATRFKNEYVVCKVCKTKVQKVRANQQTCLGKECQYATRAEYKYRGIKAEHVRDLGTL